MSWTVVRGHRPVAAPVREPVVGEHGSLVVVDELKPRCSCGEGLYDPAHIGSLLDD